MKGGYYGKALRCGAGAGDRHQHQHVRLLSLLMSLFSLYLYSRLLYSMQHAGRHWYNTKTMGGGL